MPFSHRNRTPPTLSTVVALWTMHFFIAVSSDFHMAQILGFAFRHRSTVWAISSLVMPILSAPNCFSALTPPP